VLSMHFWMEWRIFVLFFRFLGTVLSDFFAPFPGWLSEWLHLVLD
jgi:hypothetical protein